MKRAISGSKGSIKYSYSTIFGDHHVYCFDIKRKKEFVDFLMAKFFMVNEHPDVRILHQYGLHWGGCCKKNVKKGSII